MGDCVCFYFFCLFLFVLFAFAFLVSFLFLLFLLAVMVCRCWFSLVLFLLLRFVVLCFSLAEKFVGFFFFLFRWLASWVGRGLCWPIADIGGAVLGLRSIGSGYPRVQQPGFLHKRG